MKRKTILMILLVAIATMVVMSSCTKESTSADGIAQKQTDEAMLEAQRQVGMPAIVNFKEKKTLRWIYELCDQENLICHAYLTNAMTGQVGQYLGKCIGYGVPYSTQFSNPEKVIEGDKMVGYDLQGFNSSTLMVLKQPEPNGLFKPDGMSATWLIMVHPETSDPTVMYVESDIIVSPFKLH